MKGVVAKADNGSMLVIDLAEEIAAIHAERKETGRTKVIDVWLWYSDELAKVLSVLRDKRYKNRAVMGKLAVRGAVLSALLAEEMGLGLGMASRPLPHPEGPAS